MAENWLESISDPVLRAFFTEAASTLFKSGLNKLDKLGYRRRLRLAKLYAPYVQSSLSRITSIKTILSSSPQHLSDLYVQLDGAIEGSIILDLTYRKIVERSRYTSIIGPAGFGKSTILRHFFKECISFKDRVPVFVEIRTANEEQLTLEQLLIGTLSSSGSQFDREDLYELLSLGKVLILVDGLDELKFDLRNRFFNEVDSLVTRYPDNCWILTSRPIQSAYYVNRFKICELKPLSWEKTQLLVSKLNFDEEIRERFIAEIERGDWKTFSSLAGNPLLVNVMIRAYERHASIPLKVSALFDQLFDVLYDEHNSTKLFKRHYYTSLSKDEFQRILGAFSLLGYLESIYKFSGSRMQSTLIQARTVTGLSVTYDDFVKDLVECLSIVYEENGSYSFIHRTFQEYFAAFFVTFWSGEHKSSLMERLRPDRDHMILRCIFELSKADFEKYFLFDWLSELDIGLGEEVTFSQLQRLFASCIASITVSKEVQQSEVLVEWNLGAELILLVRSFYGEQQLKSGSAEGALKALVLREIGSSTMITGESLAHRMTEDDFTKTTIVSAEDILLLRKLKGRIAQELASRDHAIKTIFGL